MDISLKNIRKWAAIFAVLGAIVFATRFFYNLEVATLQNKQNIQEVKRDIKVLDNKIDNLTLEICYLAKREGRL